MGITLNLVFSYLQQYPDLTHLSIIIGLFLATFWRILGPAYSWVIDDIEGIARFSERWVQEKDPTGKIIKESKVDSYDIGESPKKKTVKFLSFIPALGFPGCFLRFIRLHIGKKYKVIGSNEKGHEIWGYEQSPRRHHILSIAVQALNLVLGYFFVKRWLGADIAFGSCLLFSVNPLTTQMVAWISGINYSLSMVFALAVLLACSYLSDPHIVIPLTVAFTFLSGVILYIGCFTWIILLFLGFKWAAFSSAIVGFFIIFWKGTETKNYRTAAFKEQNMDHTTKFNLRKPIVMVKTFGYYASYIFLPLKLGLYHVWGYFYEDPIERITPLFWGGVVVVFSVTFFLLHGATAVQLGLVWFLSYFFIFSNFITAQQFVADRYITVPAFGINILLASLLYPTPFFWVLVGLYAMRTFCHLPSFRNEIDFYLSNFLNFRESEVALGNLGVAYMNHGMPGSSVDTWMLSTKVNPFYDVAWYNLYSVFKSNGRNAEALQYIKKCLDAKIVHFKDRWQKEHDELQNALQVKIEPVPDSQVPEWQKVFDEARLFFNAGNVEKEKEILLKLAAMATDGMPQEIINGLQKRIKEIEPNNV